MKKIFLLILVGPLLLTVRAQVPVSKEPRHHDVLDNAWVRLLDVHIPPGDTSQFHIHATPSVFLILSDAETGSQVIQEEDRSKSPVHDYGHIWFEGFYKLPRIHRVWNSGTSEFHVMDIELPNKNYIIIDSPIRQEAFTLLFEEKPVRVYRIKLSAHQGVSLNPRKANTLLIQIQDSAMAYVNLKSLSRKGDYIYIPSGQSIDVKNDGEGKSELVFLELK